MRAFGSLAPLARTTTGLLGSVWILLSPPNSRGFSDEDAPQREDDAGGNGGGVEPQPGDSLTGAPTSGQPRLAILVPVNMLQTPAMPCDFNLNLVSQLILT